MPAYNAASTLEKTYRAIPRRWVSRVILFDDKSHDDTISGAKNLELEIAIHSRHLGYGENQKTSYRIALNRLTEVIVMLHHHYQYYPRRIPAIIEPIKQ